MTASQRLYLAGVLPSRQEASAEHGGGDPVGVGPLAVLLGQGGQVQAVQALQTADCPRPEDTQRDVGNRTLPLQRLEP